MLMPISINVHCLLQVYAPLLPEEKWGRGKGELGDDGISCEGVGIERDQSWSFVWNSPRSRSIYGFLHPTKKSSQQKHLETFVEAGHQENRKGKYTEKTRLSRIQACQGRWGRNCRRGSSQTYEPWWAHMDGSCQALGGPKKWLVAFLIHHHVMLKLGYLVGFSQFRTLKR